MKVPETSKPSLRACCGRPLECPCFQKFHEMKTSCLDNYYRAILADDTTTVTANSTSRAESLEPYKKATKSALQSATKSALQSPTKSTLESKAGTDTTLDLVSASEIFKVTCPRCLLSFEKANGPSVIKKTDTSALCDHCRTKLRRPKFEQGKIKKFDEGIRRVAHRDREQEQRYKLKRLSSSEINLQLLRAGLGKQLNTKLMFRSELNLLQPHTVSVDKSVGFKKSHELVELYQSSSFRPVSDITLSDIKLFKDEVPPEQSKMKPHHLGDEEKLLSCSDKPISEPTLLKLGREEKLTEYQKLMQSKVKRITGYDMEKGMIYYFPKVSKLELKRHVSTSELIRDAREKHGSKFDDEAKRLEEEEKLRLEQLTREREAEERRRRARERWEKAKGKQKPDDKSKKTPKELISLKSQKPPASQKPPISQEPTKVPRESKGPKQPKEPKELKEPKEPKEPKQPKEPKEPKEPKKDTKKDENDMTSKKKGKELDDVFKRKQSLPATQGKNESETAKLNELADLLAKLKEEREKERTQVMPPQREPPLKPPKRRGKKPKSPYKLEKLSPESSSESFEGHKLEAEDIVIGEKLLKYKPPAIPQDPFTLGAEVMPMLFKSKHSGEQVDVSVKVRGEANVENEEKKAKDGREGIFAYALSERSFIDKGWTVLPVEKVVRKMNVYRMRPAHPEFDWFQHNKNKVLMTYDSGEKLAEIDDNGRGRWYYRNGRLALDYYDAEEANAQQRLVVYSNGEPDERGRSRPATVLATFDYLGNGVVFDHSGKIRLKYNQTDGIVLDRGIGPVSHWKWHTLNDPPVLQQVMIDTHMPHKDPVIWKMGGPADFKTRPDNEEMLAIEFDNFIKEKNKKTSQSFKPFQIKMKALKINENFSLKVLDQATIYLIFRDGSTNLKQNIGMILDPQEIVDTDTAELGVVANSLERLPARTQSIAALQRSIAYAQHYEKTRTERDRRLRPQVPAASADRLTAARARGLRPPPGTAPLPAPVPSVGGCGCTRKPRDNNLYYNSRLM